MNDSTSPTRRVYLALILVQVLFGINYIASKVIVTALPPLAWGSIRISVAALVMLMAALLSGRRHPSGGWKFFGPLVLFALLGIVISQGAFMVGLRRTTATNSAILCTLIPVFTLMIVTLRGQEKLTWLRALGFLSAFGGVLVIRKVEEISITDQTLFGDLLTIVCALSSAIFFAISREFMMKYDRVWITAWLFIYGTVGFAIVSIPDWASFSAPVITPILLWSMAFGIIGGTLITYFLNVWALSRTRSSSVAIFIYVQPMITAALAWFCFGEVISLRTVLASSLIFLGMILALIPARKKIAQTVEAAVTLPR